MRGVVGTSGTAAGVGFPARDLRQDRHRPVGTGNHIPTAGSSVTAAD